MTARSWLIRGLILGGVAVLATLGWVASSWVSPARVREEVLAHLRDQFDGVEVHVGSARMRILGGIAVTDLRLVRRGDPPDRPFLEVPAAVIYHDKEQLNRGRLVIRKVELESPELRLERSAAGVWNVADVLRPGPADKPVPTFLARGATVTVTDHAPGGLPPLRLTGARLTLLNDPLPFLTVQAQAAAGGFGPVQIRGRLNRITNQVSVGLELPEFPLGDAAAAAAGRVAPALAPHLVKLSATAAVRADLTYAPDAAPAWRHDVRVEVQNGRFEHPDLPWPAEQIALKVRSVDGRVRVEEATARLGPARVRLALETRADAASPGLTAGSSAHYPRLDDRGSTGSTEDALAQLEDHLQRLDMAVAGVPLDGKLFDRLGEDAQKLRRMFAPDGSADLVYRFAREAAGWKRELELRPQRIGIKYEKFPYPVADVRGWVKRTATHAGPGGTQVDLVGTAGGQPVTINGQLHGDGPDPFIDLKIRGHNVPIDDQLYAALPGKYAALARQFRATGRGDFVAEIKQQHGVNLCENEFRLELRDARVNYTRFPYPLEQVKGRLVVRVAVSSPERPVRPGGPREPPPDRDEIILDGFTAVHAGATIWLHGSKRPVPGARDRRLVLQLGGNNCPLDDDLRTALAGFRIDSLWATFDPRGTLTFAADLEVLDRAGPPDRPDDEPPFDPMADLRLTFSFSGPTVTPTFFPYELTDLAGALEYRNGRVELIQPGLAGRHGETRVRLAAGEVRFYPDGAVWANLGGLEVKPLVADAAFLRALPGQLRSGVEQLGLRGGAELAVKHLVVLTPPDPPAGGSIPPPEPLPIGPVSLAVTPPESPLNAVARGQSPASPTPTRPPTAEPDPVVYWDLELKLAGAAIDAGVPWEELFGAFACRGRYEGTHLGLVRGNAWLDRAVIARQPVSGARFHVRVNPQQPDPARPGRFLPPQAEFTDLAGRLFHGALGGEARVVLADPVRYEVWLTAADVQLDEVARHYKLGSDADLKGVAQAQLRLYNRPDPRTGLLVVEGAGKLDVPTGRMYNLPVLLDLVKVLKLQAPDKTAFEEAHATFRIQGDRVKVDQLDLIGKAICLGGAGEVDTTGEYVRFEFYTLGSQILAKLVNTPVGDLSAFLSKNLFKIRMTRESGELKYRTEAVPLVTQPARAVIERMRAGAARLMSR